MRPSEQSGRDGHTREYSVLLGKNAWQRCTNPAATAGFGELHDPLGYYKSRIALFELEIFAGTRLKPHLPVCHHYSVLDGFTVELSANLARLVLHERGKGVERA